MADGYTENPRAGYLSDVAKGYDELSSHAFKHGLPDAFLFRRYAREYWEAAKAAREHGSDLSHIRLVNGIAISGIPN